MKKGRPKKEPPIKTYRLSDEELAKYRALPRPEDTRFRQITATRTQGRRFR